MHNSRPSGRQVLGPLSSNTVVNKAYQEHVMKPMIAPLTMHPLLHSKMVKTMSSPLLWASYLIHHKSYDNAESLLMDLKENNPPNNQRESNKRLYHLVKIKWKQGNLDEARKIFHEMTHPYSHLRFIATGVLIQAISWDHAVQCHWHRLFKSSKDTFSLVHSIAIKALTVKGVDAFKQHIYQQLLESNQSIKFPIVLDLLRIYRDSGQYDAINSFVTKHAEQYDRAFLRIKNPTLHQFVKWYQLYAYQADAVAALYGGSKDEKVAAIWRDVFQKSQSLPIEFRYCLLAQIDRKQVADKEAASHLHQMMMKGVSQKHPVIYQVISRLNFSWLQCYHLVVKSYAADQAFRSLHNRHLSLVLNDMYTLLDHIFHAWAGGITQKSVRGVCPVAWREGSLQHALNRMGLYYGSLQTKDLPGLRKQALVVLLEKKGVLSHKRGTGPNAIWTINPGVDAKYTWDIHALMPSCTQEEQALLSPVCDELTSMLTASPLQGVNCHPSYQAFQTLLFDMKWIIRLTNQRKHISVDNGTFDLKQPYLSYTMPVKTMEIDADILSFLPDDKHQMVIDILFKAGIIQSNARLHRLKQGKVVATHALIENYVRSDDETERSLWISFLKTLMEASSCVLTDSQIAQLADTLAKRYAFAIGKENAPFGEIDIGHHIHGMRDKMIAFVKEHITPLPSHTKGHVLGLSPRNAYDVGQFRFMMIDYRHRLEVLTTQVCQAIWRTKKSYAKMNLDLLKVTKNVKWFYFLRKLNIADINDQIVHRQSFFLALQSMVVQAQWPSFLSTITNYLKHGCALSVRVVAEGYYHIKGSIRFSPWMIALGLKTKCFFTDLTHVSRMFQALVLQSPHQIKSMMENVANRLQCRRFLPSCCISDEVICWEDLHMEALTEKQRYQVLTLFHRGYHEKKPIDIDVTLGLPALKEMKVALKTLSLLAH